MGPLHPLKRDNYENCMMLHPSGEPMFRCLRKTVNWYVSRNLATILPDDPRADVVAQFAFEPKGTGHAGDNFFLKVRRNECVVCGTAEQLTRHHIMPHCYIKFFPLELRRNNSYDVMTMCVEHHHEYEESAKLLKKELGLKYKAPVHGIGGGLDVDLYHAHAFIKTLIKFHHKIPAQRKQEMLDHISSTLGVEAKLEDLVNFSVTKKDYAIKATKSHGELVLEHITDLDEFVIMWRKHFLHHMDPQFLPDNWDCERRIYSEKDTGKRAQTS
jgi:hypothetical protein